MNRRVRQISEIGMDFADAPFGTKLKTKDYTDEGVPVIQGRNIKENRFEWNHALYVSPQKFLELRRSHCREGDLVFPKIGTIGITAIMPKVEGHSTFLLSTNMMKMSVDPNVADLRYVYFYFCQQHIRDKIRSTAGGSSQPIFNFTTLKAFEIELPSLTEQERIASVLSAYDDLIVNNTRHIKILEEMAQMLYREWLVNFRFPSHQEVKFMESESGPIPAGWMPKRLGDLCAETRRGVDPGEIDPATPYIGLEHLPRKSIALGEWGRAGDVGSTKLRFKRGEILFGKIRPYFHKVGVAPIDGVASSDAIVIVPNDPAYFGLVLCCVSSEDFVRHATQTSQGTKMPRANWDVLTKYPLPLPSGALLKQFNGIIHPTVEMLQNLVFRNRNLRTTRDFLLPKLISGEIPVEAVAELVEQAV